MEELYIKNIQEICDTVDWLYERMDGVAKGLTYEELQQFLIDEDGEDYTVDIVHEEDGQSFFDVNIGNMTFTIHRTDDGGYRINDFAYFNTFEDNACETIRIRL